jgi:hypothetical protein
MKLRYMPFAAISAFALLAGTAQAQSDSDYSQLLGLKSTTYPCNNAQFLQDQQNFENHRITADQFVDVCGTVTAVLPAKHTTSGNHGYFYVQVAQGVTIEIVSDLDQMNAPKWPWVAVGDSTYVQGRYYYDNDTSQGIDWTHHGTSSSWPHAGYVVVNGTEYQ